MNARVCAVAVAYNNPGELARLLSSLNGQNALLNGLVIVDNSEDHCLVENKKVFDVYSKTYALARYHKSDGNVGSAGGFRRGMQIAHANGFGWVWLLDQDGAAFPGCLTELLAHCAEGDILCPTIVDIDRPGCRIPKAYLSNFFGELYPATSCSDACRVRNFGTHAALISREALDAIGYYDDSFFFVGFEDLDYGHRAVQAGLIILLVPTAEASHPIKCPNKSLKWASKIGNSVPRRLNYVTDLDLKQPPCSRTRSISAFSQAYLESKRLESWQFGMALAYSMCRAAYSKIKGKSGICLTITLRTYLKCFALSLRRDWPYNSIEQLCREILQ
jgi:GT2 family glycosyltransferase